MEKFDITTIQTPLKANDLMFDLGTFTILAGETEDIDYLTAPDIIMAVRITGSASDGETIMGHGARGPYVAKTLRPNSCWHLDVAIADVGDHRQVIIYAFGDPKDTNGYYLPLSKKKRNELISLMLNEFSQNDIF